jgi:hypothetical protein
MNYIHLAQDRTVAGSCERGSDPPTSITGGEFLDQLSDY